MIQIKASFSKRNTSRTESCAAEIAVDLSSEASDIQIKERLDTLFGMMKTTTEKHLNAITIDCKPVIDCKPIQALQETPRHVNQFPHTKGHSSTKPASESQISLLKTLASKNNVPIEELAMTNNVKDLHELSSKTCNDLIQSLKA